MAWDLNSFADIVRSKFMETPLIDITTPLTEMQTVKLAIVALRNWGVRMNEIVDIPQFWHLMFYHDDEYSSKFIAGKDDQMQTAKATLFALSGDCEDIHRLYQLAAITLGVPAYSSKLLVIFFGSSEKIVGGHATTLIVRESTYVNLDYDKVITSNSIGGILKYHTRYATPQVYVLLDIDPSTLKSNIVQYKNAKAYSANISGTYNVLTIPETKSLKKLKYHLHRTSEHGKQDITPFLFLLGGITAGIILGR